MKKVERKKFEQSLTKLRESLTRNYRDTGEEPGDLDDGTPDYLDFATRSYTKEFLLSLSNLDRQQLKNVEAALRRVRTDDYGLCISCGELISKKRLLAAPWVELCIDCQEEHERGTSHGGRGFQVLDQEPEPEPAEK
jgi:DnaK suppressor protein